MEDVLLRCNRQAGHYCRARLTDRAVVTTCSHIFCLNCATESGLADASAARRQCPTCGSSLPNADDAVTTSLKPSEDYKTSVLSGLDPNTIMECAGRALAFWTYQTSQEMLYQEFLSKNLTEKYSSLSNAMDKLVHEANSEIKSLQEKIGTLHIDHKSLRDKNAELIDLYREKSKKHTQTQHLYDMLKKRVMAGQIQLAATETVSQTLHSMTNSARPETYNGTGYHDAHTQNAGGERGKPVDQIPVNRNGVEQLMRHQRSGSGSQYNGDALVMPPPGRPLGGARNPFLGHTPMHRAHLPGTTRATANRSQIPLSTSRPSLMLSSQVPLRSAMRDCVGNPGAANRSGLGTVNSYGISAGMKVGGSGGTGMSNGEPTLNQYSHHLGPNGAQTSAMGHRQSNSLPANGSLYQ